MINRLSVRSVSTMKVILLCFVSLLVIIYSNADKKIVLRTEKNAKAYNFFPIACDHLEFRVKATNDIHVSLTSNYTLQVPYYEIVIGGWGNTKSAIRKETANLTDNQVSIHKGFDVEQQAYGLYWLKLNHTKGTISVGKGHEVEPFLYYKDPEYIKMKYFGLSTGFGSPGQWLLDMDVMFCAKQISP